MAVGRPNPGKGASRNVQPVTGSFDRLKVVRGIWGSCLKSEVKRLNDSSAHYTVNTKAPHVSARVKFPHRVCIIHSVSILPVTQLVLYVVCRYFHLTHACIHGSIVHIHPNHGYSRNEMPHSQTPRAFVCRPSIIK